MSRPEAAMAPLRFLRTLTCSDRRWRAQRSCAPLTAGGFALHPYTLRWRLQFRGPGPDDVTTGSLDRLTSALDLLARRGALATPARRALDLYLTEWGFHAHSARIPEPLRSRYVLQALDLLSHEPRVRQLIWYQLAAAPDWRRGIWDTALLDDRGLARPTYRVMQAWAQRRVIGRERARGSGRRSRRAG